MRLRDFAFLEILAFSSCAASASGTMPLAVGVGAHAMQCDASGTQYQILQPGKYLIHLESKRMSDKTGVSLCVEPTPDGWRPPDPCRSDVDIDNWRTDRGADWIVELRAGNGLAVWLKEGGFTTRALTRCPAGAQVDSAIFSSSGGFSATFVVTRL